MTSTYRRLPQLIVAHVFVSKCIDLDFHKSNWLLPIPGENIKKPGHCPGYKLKYSYFLLTHDHRLDDLLAVGGNHYDLVHARACLAQIQLTHSRAALSVNDRSSRGIHHS